MNEGQTLLLNILKSKIKSIESMNKDDIIYDGVNLVELLNMIDQDEDNFYLVPNSIIEYVCENSNIKNASTFKNNAIKIRDLLIGKKDYKLVVNLNDTYKSTIKSFIKNLNKILESKIPGVVNIDSISSSVRKLQQTILNREIINDFDLIEDLLLDYNETDFDANMVKVMKFVNEHNISILKTKKKNAPIFAINFIHRPKIDERIVDILEKLEINYKDLPNYLISELKRCNVSDVCNTYNIIKQNKAEEGGVLHLIKKENTLAHLILLLYASETSIKSVLNSIKDSKKTVNINILKILLNNIITCFLSKNNDYFKPKFEDFIKNMSLLKELNINYKALINKCPLFMIANNEAIEYTLKYLEKCGANRKLIINRCYKTLSLNPSLLIDNVEVLKKYHIDMESYFSENNKNYNLLKTANLDKTIEYVMEHSKKIVDSPLDYNLLLKYVVAKVVHDSKDSQEVQYD